MSYADIHYTNILFVCVNRHVYTLHTFATFRYLFCLWLSSWQPVDDVTVAGQAYTTARHCHWLQQFCSWIKSNHAWSAARILQDLYHSLY